MNNNQEKNKNRILIIGVGFFSFLIISLWLFNINRIIFNREDSLNQEEGQRYWQDLQAEINKGFMNMGEVLENLSDAEIKEETNNFVNEFKERAVSEIDLKENIEKDNKESEEKEESGKKEETEEKIVVDNYCPKFVNCMPTYNGPPNLCEVPIGCEDITLKVY